MTQPNSGELARQTFLKQLDARLWSSADKLRQQLDSANYKHIVLGIVDKMVGLGRRH